MPSVLPTSSKSYAPLADETGNMAPGPTVTRNGTVVYGQRTSSAMSSTSSADSEDLERAGGYAGSEETLSAGVSRKGKGRAIESPEETGDIGQIRRVASLKGKEKAWDIEQGHQPPDGVYPPTNEAEEEERKVQQNLARFAAKDMARRRAARESRQLPPNSTPASPRSSSSTTSFSRRPFSVISTKPNRNSIMGLMDGIWPASPKKNEGGELPMTQSPTAHDQAYHNPYDTQPTFSPAPKMVVSPTSPHNPSPFADPVSPTPAAGSSSHNRRPSLVSGGSLAQSPLTSPTDGVGFAYGGPTWRGGQAVQQQEEEQPKPDKWWHALCAWGSDLDGGHESNQQGGQVGRTNPFE
ncbi:uncharacterized protein I303_103696 [Kwoniella dejecticola CBS 10117]|uniref:Uncharacterized protein n=1 Tax=Kwoniella dejecticola CBS 10117 TaxID=1296121 RepID=A0A1A6A7G4_9TREE|nr:uncharacterized protein I303_03712 [Kwoniella dejecticola CBS 10117]OBR85997.1 hypothetical protein I303_03712 [Kwoniella dejecticola CBS 10117]